MTNELQIYSISIGWGEGEELYYIGKKVNTDGNIWKVGEIRRFIDDNYEIKDTENLTRVTIINQPLTIRTKPIIKDITKIGVASE